MAAPNPNRKLKLKPQQETIQNTYLYSLNESRHAIDKQKKKKSYFQAPPNKRNAVHHRVQSQV